jgi:hypothetical protein
MHDNDEENVLARDECGQDDGMWEIHADKFES